MTSLHQTSGSVTRAIYRNGIFPEGRPVVVRIPHSGNCLSTNQAAILIRYFKSGPASSPPGGIGSDGRLRASHLPSLPVRRIIVSGSAVLLCSWRSRSSSTRDACRSLNFCRVLLGWSVGALAQPAKQSSRRFTDGLKSLLWLFGLHDQQHTTGELGNVRKAIGEFRNVVR